MSARTQPPVRPRLFTLAWPMFIELLLGMAVGIVGTALAARLPGAWTTLRSALWW